MRIKIQETYKLIHTKWYCQLQTNVEEGATKWCGNAARHFFRSPLDRLSGRDVSAQKGSVVTLRTDHYPADRRGPGARTKQLLQDPLVLKRKYCSLEAQKLLIHRVN